MTMTRGNNSYDRDLPHDFLEAENAKSRQQAHNLLALIQQKEHIKRTRAQAIRAQYISPEDSF